MKTRKRTLPPGWYPGTENETRREIENWLKEYKKNHTFTAGIVPHAGWAYSGDLACKIISMTNPETDTIIVVGGHLPPDQTILAAREDAVDTPLGPLKTDHELLNELAKHINIIEDIYADNTVEIQLPLIKYFFPHKKIVYMRSAPTEVSSRLGEIIYQSAQKLNRKAAVIGSTDLTHYGRNYGFSPHGHGEDAVKWVKEVNDQKFITAALKMDITELLSAANNDSAACSAGGAACAISFAHASGIGEGTLVGYKTSYDVSPASSFVGYAGIGYE